MRRSRHPEFRTVTYRSVSQVARPAVAAIDPGGRTRNNSLDEQHAGVTCQNWKCNDISRAVFIYLCSIFSREQLFVEMKTVDILFLSMFVLQLNYGYIVSL